MANRCTVTVYLDVSLDVESRASLGEERSRGRGSTRNNSFPCSRVRWHPLHRRIISSGSESLRQLVRMAEIVGFVGVLPPSTPGRTGKQSSTTAGRCGWKMKRRARARTQDESLPVSFSPFPRQTRCLAVCLPLDGFRWFGRRWFKVVRISRWRRVNDARFEQGICSSWNSFGEDAIEGMEFVSLDDYMEYLWNEESNFYGIKSKDYWGWGRLDWSFLWKERIFWRNCFSRVSKIIERIKFVFLFLKILDLNICA